MIIIHKSTSFDMRVDADHYHVDICEQPRSRVYLRRSYHRVIEPLLRPLERPVEAVLSALHAHRCHDDCGVFTVVATGLDKRGCIRLPFAAQLDLWCYDLGQRQLTVLSTREVTAAVYDAIDSEDS